jgi:hypothetical protein
MKKLTDLRESFMSLKDDTTTGNVAGLAEPFKSPKKVLKRKDYDGRTKEGKKFIERMLAKRKARVDKQKEVEDKNKEITEDPDLNEASKDIGTSRGGITIVDIGRGEIQLQGKFGLMVTIKKSDMTEVIKLMKLSNLK